MENRELRDLLVKVEDMRWNESLTNGDLDSIARLLKGELDRKSDRQTGPAKGQRYWFVQGKYIVSFTYNAHDFDLDVPKYTSTYPEERFAEAELKAKELIQAVNKRRKELNEGEESGEYKFCIVFTNNSEVSIWVPSRSLYDRGLAYPFGLFKDSVDCETCMHEFEDELDWFFRDYLPLMEELDDYDWAYAPGWGEED